MTQRTKDELYLIKLYEEALKQEEMEEPLDKYEIGRLAGLQERGVNAICNLLLRTNFIKKHDEEKIYITPHGAKLAKNLLLEE